MITPPPPPPSPTEPSCCVCRDPLFMHEKDVGGWRCKCLGQDGWQCECFLRERFAGKRHSLSEYDFAIRRAKSEAESNVAKAEEVIDLVETYSKDKDGNPLTAEQILASLKKRVFGDPSAKTMFDRGRGVDS